MHIRLKTFLNLGLEGEKMLNRLIFIRHLKDPLYKNSIFIILTSISIAGFGFIFWMLAAKVYSKEDVGIATALVSSIVLLANLSKFGLDFSIVRFFPEENKSIVFSTSATITILFATLLGVMFIAGTWAWLPKLNFLMTFNNLILYLLFLISNSLVLLAGTAFIAMRRAEFRFLQSIITGLRVVFLFPLAFLGAMGIFGAFGISFMFTLAVSFSLLAKLGVKFTPKIDRRFLKDILHFSTGNYVAGLLIQSPNQILPIMVLNVLGAEHAAHYYIAFAIANLLFMIPQAVSTSLFVEGSHGEALKKSTIKSLLAIAFILTPAVICVYVFGDKLLKLIGKDYLQGLDLLKILLLASFFIAICNIYFSIKRVKKDIKELVILSGLIFTLLIGFSYILIHSFGIKGIGYAWIISYGFVLLIISIYNFKEKFTWKLTKIF